MVSNIIDRLMGRKTTSPAQSAKDRLKLVLVTDRTSIPPEDLRKMQQEILEVIRKYCRVDEDEVELKFEQRERENFLVADIPISSYNKQKSGSLRMEASIISRPEEDNQAELSLDESVMPPDED